MTEEKRSLRNEKLKGGRTPPTHRPPLNWLMVAMQILFVLCFLQEYSTVTSQFSTNRGLRLPILKEKGRTAKEKPDPLFQT